MRSTQIEHLAFEIGDNDKMQVLQDLLDHRGDGSVIVFGRTKHGVNKLARRLQADGYPVAALQGNLSQNARDRVMDDFRNGQVPVLVATNVAARGLDVSHVAQVINIELPESPELLTHRVGRTGRMGRQGQAITLLGPEDMTKWRRLERGFTRPIRRAPWRGAKALLANGNGNGHAEIASGTTTPVATLPVAQVREAARPSARRPAAPRAGKQRHVASRLPTTRGRLAARVKSPPIPRPSWRAANCCAAMVAIRGGRTGWTPSAASHPPPRHGTLALATGPHRSGARGDVISRSAPPAARPRRRRSVPIRRGRSTVTAATTTSARPAARRWPRRRFNSSSR